MIEYLEETCCNEEKPEDSNKIREELEQTKAELQKFKSKYGKIATSPIRERSIEEQSIDSSDDREIEERKIKQHKNRRKGVSAESFGEYNTKNKFIPRRIAKTQKDNEDIQNTLRETFLFKDLNAEEFQVLVDSMQIVNCEKNTRFVEENKEYEELFVVSEGEMECFTNSNGKNNFVKNLLPGDAFNEVGLLHSFQSQHTIVAVSKVTLFALSRATYREIVDNSAKRKEERIKSMFSKIELFFSLRKEEIECLSQSVERRSFRGGQNLFGKGKVVDGVYLILEGEVAVGNKTKKKGDYFGDEGLLKEGKAKNGATCIVFL